MKKIFFSIFLFANILANAAIVSPDTLEQTSKTVSDILISMQSDGQALPNSTQISTLQTEQKFLSSIFK